MQQDPQLGWQYPKEKWHFGIKKGHFFAVQGFFGPFFCFVGYKLNLPKARVPAEFGPGGKPDHLGKTSRVFLDDVR